jgi:uncharacterized protein YajQ (UPF0234 family)
MPKDLEVPNKPDAIENEEIASEITQSSELAPDVVSAPEIHEAEPAAEGETEAQEELISDENLQDASVVTTPVVEPVAAVEDRLEEEIEDILEEDLADLYLSLPSDKQKEFREDGEVTLSKIRIIAGSAKVNAKKIFKLIRDWLKVFPGVSKFFLEQEAKIKTDKILLVTEEEKKRTSNEL